MLTQQTILHQRYAEFRTVGYWFAWPDDKATDLISAFESRRLDLSIAKLTAKTHQNCDTDTDTELDFDLSLKKQVPYFDPGEVAPGEMSGEEFEVLERWEELKQIYWAAGKNWTDRQDQPLLQRFITLTKQSQIRLLDYVKRRLLDGTWRDPQHTKSLANLLSDGDFDKEELPRTLPQVPQKKPETAHERAAKAFIASRKAEEK